MPNAIEDELIKANDIDTVTESKLSSKKGTNKSKQHINITAREQEK